MKKRWDILCYDKKIMRLIEDMSTSKEFNSRIHIIESLVNSERKYRLSFDNSRDAINVFSEDRQILEVNKKLIQLSKYTKKELLQMKLNDLYIEASSPKTKERIKIMQMGEEPPIFKATLMSKDKQNIPVEIGVTPLKKIFGEEIVFISNIRDITKRVNSENDLKAALKEKEILLKEIHHRVKNNLMIISSLLNLQSKYIKDKTALKVFKESQNRAKSMALIHEYLYRSTDLKRINFGDYIRVLTIELFHTYTIDPSQITLNLNIENIMVDIDIAVPLGLIVNELVTNSMRHAFPGNKCGKINIEFYHSDNKFTLIVSDNGIGFPEDLNFENTDSLGLQLVNSLTNQIHGTIKLEDGRGTEFKIIFKELKY